VGSLTNSISDAAADIAGIVLNDIGIHPIARKAFERMEEHLARIEVTEKSILAQKTILELDLAAKIGGDIIAIRRGKHWMINPEKEVILPEDVILARGTASGLKKLEKAAKGEIRELD